MAHSCPECLLYCLCPAQQAQCFLRCGQISTPELLVLLRPCQPSCSCPAIDAAPAAAPAVPSRLAPHLAQPTHLAAGTPPRWVVIDDGWQVSQPQGSRARRSVRRVGAPTMHSFLAHNLTPSCQPNQTTSTLHFLAPRPPHPLPFPLHHSAPRWMHRTGTSPRNSSSNSCSRRRRPRWGGCGAGAPVGGQVGG